MVAIAPLILIWVGLDNAEYAILILAVIVAFFPVLANTNLGIRSVEKNLGELFSLYEANRFQRLFKLQLPYALPFILTGPQGGGLVEDVLKNLEKKLIKLEIYYFIISQNLKRKKIK